MGARRRLTMRAAMLGWVVLAVAVSAVPTRADFLSEGPTSEGAAGFVGSTIPVFFNPGPFPDGSFLGSGTNPSITVKSALEFDLTSISTIPQGAVIDSAIFSLHIAGSQSRGGPTSSISQSVSGYADADGVVMASDFGKPVTFIGETGLPGDAPPGTLNIPVNFDATNFIQSLVASRTGFVGFLLEAGSTGVSDWSRDSADPARRPNLAITFSPAVPEPSSALLMGLGIVGVLTVGWRRHVRTIA